MIQVFSMIPWFLSILNMHAVSLVIFNIFILINTGHYLFPFDIHCYQSPFSQLLSQVSTCSPFSPFCFLFLCRFLCLFFFSFSLAPLLFHHLSITLLFSLARLLMFKKKSIFSLTDSILFLYLSLLTRPPLSRPRVPTYSLLLCAKGALNPLLILSIIGLEFLYP